MVHMGYHIALLFVYVVCRYLDHVGLIHDQAKTAAKRLILAGAHLWTRWTTAKPRGQKEESTIPKAAQSDAMVILFRPSVV